MSVCLNDTDGDGDCAACARDPEAPCRVSAREALIRSVYSKLSQNQMEELLDNYAHELAEMQREHVRTLAADPFKYGSAHWAIRGADDVADLIDPEVSDGS